MRLEARTLKKYAFSHQNILYYRVVNKLLKSGCLFLLLAVGQWAGAQVIREDTTTNAPFFAAKKFDSKCYVSFEGTGTQILKKKGAMNLGFGLNWVVNHKYVVTAKYHTLTTPIDIREKVAPGRDIPPVNLIQHFAGVGFSYILFSDKKFSFQPELMVGWGAVKYTVSDTSYRKDFAVIIPAVYGVYNCTKNFRFGVGLNYRITAGGKLNGLKDGDLSGIGGLVFIRVGTF